MVDRWTNNGMRVVGGWRWVGVGGRVSVARSEGDVFFVGQRTAYGMLRGLMGSEKCI